MNTPPNPHDAPILACNLAAIDPAQREEHIATTKALFAAVLEVRPLTIGYAFRLPNDSAHLLQAAVYIANERLCCPFFHFELDVEPNQAALWLRLTGGEEVRALIQNEGMGSLLPTEVREQAGFG